MKSHIKDKAPVMDKNKIILSVGMIVKNEEKHLEKCLSALKKLLDNVPSELIIVDTGSTDKTKEIALKYTDKVFPIPRNSISAVYHSPTSLRKWYFSASCAHP